ncbi:MAG: hypothetical protein IPJ31_16690 [Bacteroidetes bacterium]|nr:hypothetical protein [Bacteroidota bacterium]
MQTPHSILQINCLSQIITVLRITALFLLSIPFLVCAQKKFSIRLDGIYFADSLQPEINKRVVILYADNSFTEINQRNPMTRIDSFLYSAEYHSIQYGGFPLFTMKPKKSSVKKIEYDALILKWDSHYINSTYRAEFSTIQDKKNKTKWGKYEISDSLLVLKSKTYSNDGLSLNIKCEERFIIINDTTIEMIQGLDGNFVVDENNRWSIGKEFPVPPIRYRFHAIDKPDSNYAWFKQAKRKIKF